MASRCKAFEPYIERKAKRGIDRQKVQEKKGNFP